jgi:hypothetical protein
VREGDVSLTACDRREPGLPSVQLMTATATLAPDDRSEFAVSFTKRTW